MREVKENIEHLKFDIMKVKVWVTQITEGLEYNGCIELNDIKFDYNVLFGVHIDKLDDQEDPDGIEELKAQTKKLFQFSLKRENEEIEIDDTLFGFLLGTVGVQVVEFYNNPQAQSSNQGVIGELVRGTSPLPGQMTIGCNVTYDIPEEDIPGGLMTNQTIQ